MAAATTDARSNGNGSESGPAARIVWTQQSVSGTPRGPDGLIQPDEYVRELLDPIRRMEIFEEMSNDGAIATALQARCQEVYAANWQLGSEDESERGAEILTLAD